MQYLEFREAMKEFTLFSLNDIRRIDKDFFRPRLNEWQEKGYIRKLIKGYYIFSDLDLSEPVLFEIANRIYSPSYVSLEMALSHYRLIPESIYGITSVSTRRTYKFDTPVTEFSYRTVKSTAFFGYELVRYDDKVYKMASVEKAILDYLYLNPDIKTADDFASLRIDKDMFFEQVNEKKVRQLLERFDQKTLTSRFNSFWDLLSATR